MDQSNIRSSVTGNYSNFEVKKSRSSISTKAESIIEDEPSSLFLVSNSSVTAEKSVISNFDEISQGNNKEEIKHVVFFRHIKSKLSDQIIKLQDKVEDQLNYIAVKDRELYFKESKPKSIDLKLTWHKFGIGISRVVLLLKRLFDFIMNFKSQTLIVVGIVVELYCVLSLAVFIVSIISIILLVGINVYFLIKHQDKFSKITTFFQNISSKFDLTIRLQNVLDRVVIKQKLSKYDYVKITILMSLLFIKNGGLDWLGQLLISNKQIDNQEAINNNQGNLRFVSSEVLAVVNKLDKLKNVHLLIKALILMISIVGALTSILFPVFVSHLALYVTIMALPSPIAVIAAIILVSMLIELFYSIWPNKVDRNFKQYIKILDEENLDNSRICSSAFGIRLAVLYEFTHIRYTVEDMRSISTLKDFIDRITFNPYLSIKDKNELVNLDTQDEKDIFYGKLLLERALSFIRKHEYFLREWIEKVGLEFSSQEIEDEILKNSQLLFNKVFDELDLEEKKEVSDKSIAFITIKNVIIYTSSITARNSTKQMGNTFIEDMIRSSFQQSDIS